MPVRQGRLQPNNETIKITLHVARAEVGDLFHKVLRVHGVFMGWATWKGNHPCRYFFSRSFKRPSHGLSLVAWVCWGHRCDKVTALLFRSRLGLSVLGSLTIRVACHSQHCRPAPPTCFLKTDSAVNSSTDPSSAPTRCWVPKQALVNAGERNWAGGHQEFIPHRAQPTHCAGGQHRGFGHGLPVFPHPTRW